MPFFYPGHDFCEEYQIARLLMHSVSSTRGAPELKVAPAVARSNMNPWDKPESQVPARVLGLGASLRTSSYIYKLCLINNSAWLEISTQSSLS